MQKTIGILLLAGSLVQGSGCTTKQPTIAHVHVGHAITGWVETPDKQGLLVTAEQEATIVSRSAADAVNAAGNLPAVKSSINDALHAMDPKGTPNGTAGLGFGLLPAVEGTLSHMAYAAESDDASANVRTSVPAIVDRSREIVGRCQEIQVLGQAVSSSRSAREATVLAGEIKQLADRVIDASAISGYGLAQLRTDIEAMIAREEPPYTTVDTWYLLNLVRLPTGKWIFQQRAEGDKGYTYDYR